MAKFKVGDKVRIVFGDGFIEWVSDMRKFIGKTVTISEVSEDSKRPWFRIAGHYFHWNECDAELIEQPRREFIVIHRSGNVMTAEHRVNREIIKSAKATCAPSDTFDFETGAKLAFDRLMGREEPKPAPQPAHRFKVGDRVVTTKGYGTIVLTEKMSGNGSNLVSVDGYTSGHAGNGWSSRYGIDQFRKDCMWVGSINLSPAPAPEPPKYYTGKVVCISGEYGIGKVFTVRNGFFTDGDYNCPDKPYKSVDDMNSRFLFGKFAALKE